MTKNTDTETVSKTFKIHQGRLTWFVAKMTKLAKRAAKLGCTAPSYVFGEVEEVKETGEGGAEHIVRYTHTTISGEAPKFAGWTIAATIQTLDEGGVIVRSITETPIPLRYRAQETASACEHCNAKRRRTETFVVRHDDGSYKQVGRQCIADFLGHQDPETLARRAGWLSEAMGLGEASGYGDCGESSLVIEYYLGFVAAAMNAWGWVSRTKAKEEGGVATANAALRHANPSKEDTRNPNFERLVVSQYDRDRASAALNWAEDLSDADVETSDYLYNLRTIARAGAVEYKTAGYAASIIIAHDKALDRVRAKAERPISNYVGTIGKREVFTITLEKVLEIDSDFGVSYLHMMVDGAGNQLKWFGSCRLHHPYGGHRVADGEKVQVKATVKGHKEYKGDKQTMVNRVEVYVEVPKGTKKNVAIAQGVVDAFTALNSSS